MHYCAFPFDEERGELPAQFHHGEHVGLEEFVQLGFIVVERGDDIVAARVVVEYIKLTICDLCDAFAECSDRFVARELEGKVCDAGVGRRVF